MTKPVSRTVPADSPAMRTCNSCDAIVPRVSDLTTDLGYCRDCEGQRRAEILRAKRIELRVLCNDSGPETQATLDRTLALAHEVARLEVEFEAVDPNDDEHTRSPVTQKPKAVGTLEDPQLQAKTLQAQLAEVTAQRNTLRNLVEDMLEVLTPPKSGCDCDMDGDRPLPCVFHRFEREMRNAIRRAEGSRS